MADLAKQAAPHLQGEDLQHFEIELLENVCCLRLQHEALLRMRQSVWLEVHFLRHQDAELQAAQQGLPDPPLTGAPPVATIGHGNDLRGGVQTPRADPPPPAHEYAAAAGPPSRLFGRQQSGLKGGQVVAGMPRLFSRSRRSPQASVPGVVQQARQESAGKRFRVGAPRLSSRRAASPQVNAFGGCAQAFQQARPKSAAQLFCTQEKMQYDRAELQLSMSLAKQRLDSRFNAYMTEVYGGKKNFESFMQNGTFAARRTAPMLLCAFACQVCILGPRSFAWQEASVSKCSVVFDCACRIPPLRKDARSQELPGKGATRRRHVMPGSKVLH